MEDTQNRTMPFIPTAAGHFARDEVGSMLDTAFGHHHRTIFIYPSYKPITKLKRRERYDKPFFLPPHDVNNRRQPKDLTSDPVVTKEFPRLQADPGESFFTLTKASLLQPTQVPDLEAQAGRLSIENCMPILARAHGFTRIHIMTFARKDGVKMLLWYRETTLWDANGKSSFSESLHGGEMKMELLDPNIPGSLFAITRHQQQPLPNCVREFDHLVRRVSDRAELAFQFNLAREGWKDYDVWKDDWKKVSREPRYDLILKSAPHPISEEAKREPCRICGAHYDADQNPIAVLPCHPTHVACVQCFDEWCRVGGGKTKCPHCRTLVFDDEQKVNLKLGQDYHGVFQNVPDFTEWENFERACIDLDRFAAKTTFNLAVTLKVNAEHLLAIFDFFLEHLQEEPESSTPKQQNPTFFPETAILRRAFISVVEDLDCATMKAKTVHRMINEEVQNVMERAYYRAGLHRFRGDNAANENGLRPDFPKFKRKMLTRTIFFAVKRRNFKGKEFWHDEKGKLHYNPHLPFPRTEADSNERDEMETS